MFFHFATKELEKNGRAGDPLPVGYKDKKESPTYQARNQTVDTSRFFSVQSFVSDVEPTVESHSLLTWIWWQPLTILVKRGWTHCPWFVTDHFQKGIGVVPETDLENYWSDWSQHARRHREKWLKDDRFEMIDVDFETFSKAYHAAGRLNWFARKECMWLLGSHVRRYPEDVRLFGVRDIQSNKIVAGLAVIQYNDIKQSVHTTSFIHDSVRQTSVGVGLIDHWYRSGIAEGIRFFNFGNVWKKGDPRGWKGFSKFKRQFDLTLLVYPVPMVKLMRRKKE